MEFFRIRLLLHSNQSKSNTFGLLVIWFGFERKQQKQCYGCEGVESVLIKLFHSIQQFKKGQEDFTQRSWVDSLIPQGVIWIMNHWESFPLKGFLCHIQHWFFFFCGTNYHVLFIYFFAPLHLCFGSFWFTCSPESVSGVEFINESHFVRNRNIYEVTHAAVCDRRVPTCPLWRVRKQRTHQWAESAIWLTANILFSGIVGESCFCLGFIPVLLLFTGCYTFHLQLVNLCI